MGINTPEEKPLVVNFICEEAYENTQDVQLRLENQNTSGYMKLPL